jgi:hypothetical protein
MTKCKGLRTNVSLALQRKEKSACILTKHMYICKKFCTRCDMPLEVPVSFSVSAGASAMGRPN